jgi:PhoH-like ATPase
MPLPKAPKQLADRLEKLDQTETTLQKNKQDNQAKPTKQSKEKVVEKNHDQSNQYNPNKRIAPAEKISKSSKIGINAEEKINKPVLQPSNHQKDAHILHPHSSAHDHKMHQDTRQGMQHTNKKSKVKTIGEKRLFVLDTNVLLHDSTSLFRFEEHDVYLAMVVLEELDNHKKGLSDVSRNARMISRTLDQLLSHKSNYLIEGVALNGLGNTEAGGHLFFQTQDLDVEDIDGFTYLKADNQILAVVQALQKKHPAKQVVLVSKDINMRIKANALNIPAEDYYNDHVLDDADLLYRGYLALPEDFWAQHSTGMESWQNPKTGETFYKLQGPSVAEMMINQFVYLDMQDGSLPFYAQVSELNHKFAVLKTIADYSHQKNKVWGIMARNKEQNFALNLLMNPEVDFVSLLGQAGTGKTLLTLAAALEQVIEEKRYNEIIVTRATVPLGEDIGFLPGTEEEKMQPWMGALDDNLEVLQGDTNANEWGKSSSLDYIRSKIKIKSMSFMRGRTFVNKFVIIDEAQNLTPKQMKALITRAGPGTKIICMGNIAQIDTPYLTEGSSGLTYVVDRFKAWAHGGHITLARGERSRLADFASEVL